jgi:high-affinity K+ transport system ATPase subunit B
MKKAAALRKAAEAAGATIDENGNWVTADGKVINKENIVVSENGTITTTGGELLASAISKDEMMIAAGYTINEDGDYVDANGNIVKKDDVMILANGTVMTADGKVISGQNVTINKDGFIIAADGTVMTADGKILTGVTVNENGEVVGADGKVLRDANLIVAADGTVRDSSGNIITGVSGGTPPTPDLKIPGIIALTTGGASEEGVAKTSILPVEPVAGGSILGALKGAADLGEAQ